MALILKDGESFIDKFGSTHQDPYVVVDACNIDKLSKVAKFRVDVYASQQARDSVKKPVERYFFDIVGNDFDTYFSLQKIQEHGDQYECAYICALTYALNEYHPFEQDKWESDE